MARGKHTAELALCHPGRKTVQSVTSTAFVPLLNSSTHCCVLSAAVLLPKCSIGSILLEHATRSKTQQWVELFNKGTTRWMSPAGLFPPGMAKAPAQPYAAAAIIPGGGYLVVHIRLDQSPGF